MFLYLGGIDRSAVLPFSTSDDSHLENWRDGPFQQFFFVSGDVHGAALLAVVLAVATTDRLLRRELQQEEENAIMFQQQSP